jgi:hypothetical protein
MPQRESHSSRKCHDYSDTLLGRSDGSHIPKQKARLALSSAQVWRYSAHELSAIDLIARKRLRSCRDDVAWGDLWPSFDLLRFDLRSVVNSAKHALVIAPGGAGAAVEKDSGPFPAFTDDPAHVGSLQLVRRQNVQHDGRVGAVTSITGRKQKGRPKPPLSPHGPGLRPIGTMFARPKCCRRSPARCRNGAQSRACVGTRGECESRRLGLASAS